MMLEYVNASADITSSMWSKYAIGILIFAAVLIVVGFLILRMSEGKSLLLIVLGIFFLILASDANKTRKGYDEKYVALRELSIEADRDLEKYQKEREDVANEVNNLIKSKEYMQVVDAELKKTNNDILFTIKIKNKPETIKVKYDNIIFEGDTENYASIKDFLDYKLRILSADDTEYTVAIKK